MSQYHSADFPVKTSDQAQWETTKEKVHSEQYDIKQLGDQDTSGNQSSDSEMTALRQPSG